VHDLVWEDSTRGRAGRALQRVALRRNLHTVAVVDVVRRGLIVAGVDPDRLSTIPRAVEELPRVGRAQARRELGLAQDGALPVVGATGSAAGGRPGVLRSLPPGRVAGFP
jgi:hypothetical protein